MAETQLEKLVKTINGNGGTSNIKELDENHLLNILTKEIKRDEVFKRLQESKQEKIKIKEIVLESEIVYRFRTYRTKKGNFLRDRIH